MTFFDIKIVNFIYFNIKNAWLPRRRKGVVKVLESTLISYVCGCCIKKIKAIYCK